jgi:hypothetical protein
MRHYIAKLNLIRNRMNHVIIRLLIDITELSPFICLSDCDTSG